MNTKLKILYIEETLKDLKSLKDYIAREKLPYELVSSDSVSDARDKLDLGEFNLVLSEYHLGNVTVLS